MTKSRTQTAFVQWRLPKTSKTVENPGSIIVLNQVSARVHLQI